MKSISNHTKLIALCGKGGVGKTSISAMITRLLMTDSTRKVLVIDADPAIGLATALNVHVTKTVDDIRNDLICSIKKGISGNRESFLSQIDYEIFRAIEEYKNLAFMAIGRPETEGCYCKLNSFLKEMIQQMTCSFDYVIIDGEAGIEQVNRRVMDTITHLLLISDSSKKGIQVAESIAQVAQKNMNIHHKGLLINRIKDKSECQLISSSLPIIGYIFEDNDIYSFDRLGRSFFELPMSAAMNAVNSALNKFGIINNIK